MTTNLRLFHQRLLALSAIAIAALIAYFASGSVAAAPVPASARTPAREQQSQNWAGYVVTGKSFSSVSGSWVQPAAQSNPSSSQSYSAFWVGLGGASNQSQGLEQVGTASDNVGGQAQYYAWYELVPSAQQRLNLAVHPGDRMAGKVTVTGSTVTVYLADKTTRQSVVRTLSMSSSDISSAEWVAEAPATQTPAGRDEILPLADFGKVTFANAFATAGGHTGGIADNEWSATRIELRSQSATVAPGFRPGFIPRGGAFLSSSGSANATSSSLSSDSFTVVWHRRAANDQTAGSIPGGFFARGGDAGPGILLP